MLKQDLTKRVPTEKSETGRIAARDTETPVLLKT